MKLDRFLARHLAVGRAAAQRIIASHRVRIDARPVDNTHHDVDRFLRVELDGEVIQPPRRALYLMLHKPAGWLSATRDDRHPTVLDLIDDPDKHTLHLAGRLDRGTSGLVLLTNDGRWSKRLMDAGEKVPKIYLVETLDPIAPNTAEAFARGFHFHTENITTLPAGLEILGDRRGRLTLHEGRHHQVKRMFHRVGNRVTRLHRESIGAIKLPDDLAPGQWRELTEDERTADQFRADNRSHFGPLRPGSEK